MDPHQIATALRARDIALNPGRSGFDTAGLAGLGIEAAHPDFVAMVRCFDGFVGMGDGYIQMWDVATILAEQKTMGPQGMIAVGDILIFSEIILCDPCDIERPVVLQFGDRVLAASYAAFWAKMAAGGFA